MPNDELRLTIPALTDYAGVARVAGTGLAMRLGFAYPEIEDLRMAIDEMLIYALTAGAADDLIVTFAVTTGGVRVSVQHGAGGSASPHSVTRFDTLVNELVDSYEIDEATGTVTVLKERE